MTALDVMLVKLLLLRLRGGIRHRLRELKTLRGLLFLGVTVAVLALLMKHTALPVNPLDGTVQGEPDLLGEPLARWMPLGLLAACLLTVLTAPGPAIHFSPSEINLLFSAPFSRCALLLYKISFYAFGALLTSLLITLLLPPFTEMPVAAFAGAFLTLLFIQLLSAVIGLLGHRLAGCCSLQLRRGHVVLLLAVLVAVLAWYFSSAGSSLSDALARFQSSPAAILLLAPFEVFVQIFLAPVIYPDLLRWAVLGVAINAGLIAAIIALDRSTYESSIAASLALHQRWVRARRSGLLWGVQPVEGRSFRRPPVIGGIGPIAWRQLLTAQRSYRKAMLVFLAVALLAGPLLVIVAAEVSLWSRIGFVFFIAVYVLPRALVFDFRSDLDSMETFKVLPLRPWKISVGQLLAPVLLTSLVEWLLLGSIAMCLDGVGRVMAVGLMPFILPFNGLLYGIENLLFLLFPTPLVPVGRVDFDFLGRTLVEFAVKTSLLIGACGLAVAAGKRVLDATESSWTAFAIVTWCTLALLAILMLPLLSRAFDRFDVSRR
ncbi:MAG: hypothetical protein LJE75_03585 [Gammaproteobacteria bacterium]|jgi:hypothetical protein|nr:hypothetical protein [Gammaproteobacteria bacterium]